MGKLALTNFVNLVLFCSTSLNGRSTLQYDIFDATPLPFVGASNINLFNGITSMPQFPLIPQVPTSVHNPSSGNIGLLGGSFFGDYADYADYYISYGDNLFGNVQQIPIGANLPLVSTLPPLPALPILQIQTTPGVCATLEGQALPRYTLTNIDFASGTKIISSPGIYTLGSDIIFNPNSAATLGVDQYSAGDVQPSQYAFYNPKAYGIGFFAAISVTSSDVIIDLNGHSIVQAPEHALNQRFYFHIELGSAPFISGQGPHEFGAIESASNVCIKNGIMGLASHGGIHGNGNKDIEIHNLVIRDFEVAGIQLNGAENVVISDVRMLNGREDVPVNGRFSAARFIRPWVNRLVSGGYKGTLDISGQNLTASDIQQELRKSINDAANDVLRLGRVNKANVEQLFGNPSGLPDGSAMYGIIFNSLGIAVNGFPKGVPIKNRSKKVVVKDTSINRMKMEATDRPVLSIDGQTPATDAVGAILDLGDGSSRSLNGVYLGNVVTNAQLLVAKAIHENFDFGNLNTGKNKISSEIVAWAQSGLPYTFANLSYICNGDTMFHVNKGIVAYKFDASQDVLCDRCTVTSIENQGAIGSTLCNSNTAYLKGNGKSHPLATNTGYNGGDARGFSLSSTNDATLSFCRVGSITTNAGDAIGFDVMHGSKNVVLDNVFGGLLRSGIAHSPTEYVDNPTPNPVKQEIRVDTSTYEVKVI